jgi:hypothetical protein
VHADLDTLVIALYVTVDELLGPRQGPGRPPKHTDAELVCLAVAQVLLGVASERRWLRLAHQRLGHLFPYLPTPRPTTVGCAAPPTWSPWALDDLAVHTPIWCLASPKLGEREVVAALLDHERHQLRPGLVILADKGLAGPRAGGLPRHAWRQAVAARPHR